MSCVTGHVTLGYWDRSWWAVFISYVRSKANVCVRPVL